MVNNQLLTRESQQHAMEELVALHLERVGPRNGGRLSEKVFSYVVDGISTNKLQPGARISERVLARQLGMSHVPVREAMERLEQYGWIVRVARKGTYVAGFDPVRLNASYQLREIIESGAAYIICRQITDAQLDELKRVTDVLESAYETTNADVFRQADSQFHRLIVHFTGNRRLEDFFESVLLQAGTYFMVFWTGAFQSFARTGHAPDYVDPRSHRHIYEAIAARDADRAADLVRNHIRHSNGVLTHMIQLQKHLSEEYP